MFSSSRRGSYRKIRRDTSGRGRSTGSRREAPQPAAPTTTTSTIRRARAPGRSSCLFRRSHEIATLGDDDFVRSSRPRPEPASFGRRGSTATATSRAGGMIVVTGIVVTGIAVAAWAGDDSRRLPLRAGDARVSSAGGSEPRFSRRSVPRTLPSDRRGPSFLFSSSCRRASDPSEFPRPWGPGRSQPARQQHDHDDDEDDADEDAARTVAKTAGCAAHAGNTPRSRRTRMISRMSPTMHLLLKRTTAVTPE